MKRRTVIVALKAVDSDFEMVHLLKVALSFAVKVGKELEAADGDSTAVAKHDTPAKSPNTIKNSISLRDLEKNKNRENQLMPLLRRSRIKILFRKHCA